MDTYNIGPTTPGLFRAHEERYQELLKQLETERAHVGVLREALEYARTRFEAYGIVDFRLIDEALATIAPEAGTWRTANGK